MLYVVPFSSYLTFNNRDLEIWIISHWRSYKPIPFESFGAVSYSLSIVTMAASLTVYDIFSVKDVKSVTLKTGLRVVQGH